jgi:hypothetical protein
MEDGIHARFNRSPILKRVRKKLGLFSRSMMKMEINKIKKEDITVSLLIMKIMISQVQKYNNMVRWLNRKTSMIVESKLAWIMMIIMMNSFST